MAEPESPTCSCRDRDTRVLRAIIAAASCANDAKSALPNPDTDLLLPETGNSGNNAARLVQVLVQEGIVPGDLLMAAWQTLPAVPMAMQRDRELRAFVADVRARARLLAFSRELAWQVHEAVMKQLGLERRLDDDIRRMRQREDDLVAKRHGTYWRERDGRRTARQPTHVLVKPAAWQAMKDEAQLRHTTVGELVGGWVRDMASDPSHLENGKGLGRVARVPKRHGKGALDHLVVRLAINSHDWARAKVHAASLDVTIARYVGLTVERNVVATRPAGRSRAPERPRSSV